MTTNDVHDRICDVIDRVKLDDRTLDTDEYAGAIEQILADVLTARMTLPEDAATGKLIVQLPGRTVHWVVGPEVTALLLQQFVAGLGPALEGA